MRLRPRFMYVVTIYGFTGIWNIMDTNQIVFIQWASVPDDPWLEEYPGLLCLCSHQIAGHLNSECRLSQLMTRLLYSFWTWAQPCLPISLFCTLPP